MRPERFVSPDPMVIELLIEPPRVYDLSQPDPSPFPDHIERCQVFRGGDPEISYPAGIPTIS